MSHTFSFPFKVHLFEVWIWIIEQQRQQEKQPEPTSKQTNKQTIKPTTRKPVWASETLLRVVVISLIPSIQLI